MYVPFIHKHLTMYENLDLLPLVEHLLQLLVQKQVTGQLQLHKNEINNITIIHKLYYRKMLLMFVLLKY